MVELRYFQTFNVKKCMLKLFAKAINKILTSFSGQYSRRESIPVLHALPPRKFQFSFIIVASKILTFKTPLPLRISDDLPWGGYGFLLELYNVSLFSFLEGLPVRADAFSVSFFHPPRHLLSQAIGGRYIFRYFRID